MKISLIITVHEHLEHLHKCLLSVAAQTRKPDEIIFSDDGSQSDVRAFLVARAQMLATPVHLVRQEHTGFRLARARNNAAHIATGDLLLFLDQDIAITPDYMSTYEAGARSGRFLVGYPVRLTEEQSVLLTDDLVSRGQVDLLATMEQRKKIARQYRKDRLNELLYRLRLARYGAKLRGGICGILRQDYARVNGYDEHFIGWGNEEDDMGKRLLAAGVVGTNVMRRAQAFHIHHQPHHQNGARINRDYAREARTRIRRGGYRCEVGLDADKSDLQSYSL